MKDEILNQITENLIFEFPVFFKNIVKETKVCDTSSKLSHAHIDVLFLLGKEGAMPVSEVGKRFAISKPHMTVLTDKLIEEEFIQRIPSQTDRRIINIAITEKGNGMILHLKSALFQGLKSRMAILTDDEQRELLEALLKIKELIKKI